MRVSIDQMTKASNKWVPPPPCSGTHTYGCGYVSITQLLPFLLFPLAFFYLRLFMSDQRWSSGCTLSDEKAFCASNRFGVSYFTLLYGSSSSVSSPFLRLTHAAHCRMASTRVPMRQYSMTCSPFWLPESRPQVKLHQLEHFSLDGIKYVAVA